QMQDPKTVSWMSGALPVEEGIKSIRKRTVNLLLDTYRNCESFEEKQSVIKVLGATTKLPEMGKFGEDLVAMVADDTEVLIKQYSDILFNPEGKLIADLPIAQEIESQMLRLDGLLKKKIPGAKKLVEKIRKDKKYSFFRLLAVGKFDYDDEKDFRVSELKREQEISKLFKNLNKENIAEYTVIFNDIAVYYNQKERWQWQKFSDLIITIAREKPELNTTRTQLRD
ncbi:MAG: hypothetical protein NTW50_04980, partial [Candidatus Berkelbacteria bacterium]|nr:hypothetical protein [Candidatus Berkelbacteria bacterium]